ncbi:MAG: hypothetical protein ACOCW8_03150 [bacterium]
MRGIYKPVVTSRLVHKSVRALSIKEGQRPLLFNIDCLCARNIEKTLRRNNLLSDGTHRKHTAKEKKEMRKWYSLIDKVYSLPNLWRSYDQVKRNRGSKTAGIDGESIIEFTAQAEKYLTELHQNLKSGKFNPQAVKRVYIDKGDGSKRPLGIPTIRDRIVQQALLNILQPIFEPDFHPSSYGYRPYRSA